MLHPLLILLTAAVLGITAIDNRSLWTDELGTWALTQPTTWEAWARFFWHYPNSDGQLPFYHLTMRLWTLLAGDSEVALRAANVPWMALGLWGLTRVPLRQGGTAWIVVAAALHAFVWYYLNDARPYVLLFAGAAWATAGLLRLAGAQGDRQVADRGVSEFLLGAVLLVAGSVLGAFWIISSLIALAGLYPSALAEGLRSIGRQWGRFACAVLVGGAIVLIALHSHLAGARANQTAEFSLAGMAYGVMELLGAAGWGPSRNDLRTALGSVPRWQLGLLAAVSALAGTAVLRVWWLSGSARARTALAVAVMLPAGVLVVAGLALHWRVVGRHLSPVLPIILVALGVFFRDAARPGAGRGLRLWALCLALAMLGSALSIRWAPRHHKDDYRQAARWARDALQRHEQVLWIADELGLRYYGLAQDRRRHEIVTEVIPYYAYPQRRADTPWPQWVVLSPREGVDPRHLARPVLASGRYELVKTAPSFELYRLRP